jgi:cytochrome b561
VGVAILALMVLRIGLRWWLGAPALPAGPALMNRLAHWGHLALYAVLLAVPLSGMAAWGAGIAGAGDVHEIMVNLALILVAGHVGAALFHQFVLKDNLMARMRLGGNTR